MAPVTSPTDRDRERIGPHPSYIEIAKPYILQSRIHKCLTDINMSDAKEDIARLQGVAWIDQVRRALQLPIRTFNTAVIYYHKFRLLHSDNEYNWADASAAALFTACKIEDTLKKSREILCAHWNLKVGPGESLSSDDPRFDNHSKLIIGLERLMLESAGFDFRNRYPQKLMVKLARALKMDKNNASKTAWNLSIDLYRTFAPLKQSTPTMAIACIELAARLHGMDTTRISNTGIMRYSKWATSRAEVMETVLDLLDLYTHHRGLTSIGPLYTLETFIDIRIGLNQEASAANIPRYAQYASEVPADGQLGTNGFKPRNGIDPTSPLTPATPGTISPGYAQAPTSAIGIRGQNGTVRFMLDAARARDERNEVDRFHKIEEEEYEVEVPIEDRLEDRDKRSRDYQDHQGFEWQSGTSLDHIEDPAPLAPKDRGTRSSYWEKFRKRSVPPEKSTLQNPPTLYGNYSDNINYFGELTTGSSDSPQQATGLQQDLDEHVDTAAPVELRNDEIPRKKSHRKGREKQKAKRQARLSNAASQLREGLESLEMPTYWATETRNWEPGPSLLRQSANGLDDFNFDHGHHGELTNSQGLRSSGQGRRDGLIDRRGDFVQDASYDYDLHRPSQSSYGRPDAGYSPQYSPYSPRYGYSEEQYPERPDSPIREHGVEKVYGIRPGSVADRRDGFIQEPSFDYNSRRPSTSFHNDHVAEHQAYQDVYHISHRDPRDSHESKLHDNGEAMPYANRLSNFRKQQQRITTNKERNKQSEPYLRLEQAVQRRGATHDGIPKRSASCKPTQDTSGFVHPDRAWLRSPDENRMQENVDSQSTHLVSPMQSHRRPTPARTPEVQMRLVSPSPGQADGTRPIQAPQSGGAGKGLSAEDGHQWARGRADDPPRRGGHRGGKVRHLKHNYQGGDPGRRGRSPASERPQTSLERAEQQMRTW